MQPVYFKPARRNTDPAPSHQADAEMTQSGSRANQTYALVQAVRKYPGLTGNELARFCPLTERQISRRLNDAHDKGAIEPMEPRKCGVTGRAAREWWPA